MVADLGIDYTKLGLLIGLYFLPGIAIAYPGGLLGQYFGDKRIALFGMALMVAGGLLTAFCNKTRRWLHDQPGFVDRDHHNSAGRRTDRSGRSRNHADDCKLRRTRP